MRAKSSLYGVAILGLMLAVGVGCSKPAKGDAQISSDVQNKISTDSALQGRQVAVQSNNGVVTLSGTVNSDAERIAASNDASRVDGVHQVLNNLTVAPAQQAAATPQPEPQAQPAPEPERRPSGYTSRRNTSSRSTAHHDTNSNSSNGGSSSNNQTAMSAAPMNAAPTQTTPAPPPAPVKVSIPDGTALSVRLTDGLDSEKNQAGDTFRATLNSPITLEDNVVVPDGADIEGRVIEVKSAGKFAGASLLSVELTKLSFNGHSYQIHTNNWHKEGASRGKNTAAKVGGGAALGAIIGGIAGGGKGAAIGTIVGAGAGTGAQVVTHGQQIKLNPEQLMSFTLASPVSVFPSKTNRNGGQKLPVPSGNESDQ